MANSEYEEYFKPELEALDDQYTKNESLYNDVYKGMEKNLGRLDARTMLGGGSSPYRDISELGKVLNDIRGNQVSTIKEKTTIKKTIKELELRRENMTKTDNNNVDAQSLMKELITSIQSKTPEFSNVTVKEKTDYKGLDKLNNLDPEEIGINENDLRMIDKFNNTGKNYK